MAERKKTINDLQNTAQKTKDRATYTPQTPRVILCAPERYAVPGATLW